MTRRLTVVEEFDRGTLLEVTPRPEYADDGTAHAYYVPDRARRDAGMAKVNEMESAAAYRDADGTFDWAAIEDLVTASEIVERVEAKVLNRADGAVETSSMRRPTPSWRTRSADEQATIPDGVVKFGDPDSDHEDAPYRDPIERGRCWARVRDALATDSANKRVPYRDDVQQSHVLRARVPMGVVRAGDDLVAAYLAAHDHGDRSIAHVLDTDVDEVADLIAGVR